MNDFNTAPANFASEAVLVLASASDAPLPSSMDGAPPGGLNHAALKWGETLLQFHGARQRAAVSGSAASDRARYFGYSTTAFYHHNPCDPCVLPPRPRAPEEFNSHRCAELLWSISRVAPLNIYLSLSEHGPVCAQEQRQPGRVVVPQLGGDAAGRAQGPTRSRRAAQVDADRLVLVTAPPTISPDPVTFPIRRLI